MIKNQQPIMAADRSLGEALLLHSVFKTIQGEGPFAGTPATFIRLAGCNLQCPLCDTEYTDGAAYRKISDIVADVAAGPPLVVITGGEPFRQNVAPLIVELDRRGFRTQIETNGILPPQDFLTLKKLVVKKALTIVVAPKTNKVNLALRSIAGAWKYVIDAESVDPTDKLPVSALDHPLPAGKRLARPGAEYAGPIWVQPADVQDVDLNKLHTAAAVRSTLADPARRRLCLQIHKYAELP